MAVEIRKEGPTVQAWFIKSIGKYYAAATDTIYLIGNVKAEIRFSNTVTNINGAEASDYNEGTSAIGCSLNITAKNDGEPIVVNMAATGKLNIRG